MRAPTTARELVRAAALVSGEPAREPPLAPAPPLRPAAARLSAPSPRVSVSQPFAARTALGASFVVLLVPVPVPVPARGPRVSPHAGPRLLHSSCAPFLSRVAAAEQAAVCSAAMHKRLICENHRCASGYLHARWFFFAASVL